MAGGVSMRRGLSMAGHSEGPAGRCNDGARNYKLLAGLLGCVLGRLAVLVEWAGTKAITWVAFCERGAMLLELATAQQKGNNKIMFALGITPIIIGITQDNSTFCMLGIINLVFTKMTKDQKRNKCV